MPKNRNNDVFKGRPKLISSGLLYNSLENPAQQDSLWQDLTLEEMMAVKWGDDITSTLLTQFPILDPEIIYDVLNMCNGDVHAATEKLSEMVGGNPHKKHSNENDLATIACSLLSYEAFGNTREFDSPELTETMIDSSFHENGLNEETNCFGNSQYSLSSNQEMQESNNLYSPHASHSSQHHSSHKIVKVSNAIPVNYHNMNSFETQQFSNLTDPNKGNSKSSENSSFSYSPWSQASLNLLPSLHNSFLTTKENSHFKEVNTHMTQSKTSSNSIGFDAPLTNGHLIPEDMDGYQQSKCPSTSFIEDRKFFSANSQSEDLTLNMTVDAEQVKRRKKRPKKKNKLKIENEGFHRFILPDTNITENDLSGKKTGLKLHSVNKTDSDRLMEQNKLDNISPMSEKLLKLGLSREMAGSDVSSNVNMLSHGTELLFNSYDCMNLDNSTLPSPDFQLATQNDLSSGDKNLTLNRVDKKSSKGTVYNLLPHSQASQLNKNGLTSDDQLNSDERDRTSGQVWFDPLDPLGWNSIFRDNLATEPKSQRSKTTGNFTDKKQPNIQSKSKPPWAETVVKPRVFKEFVLASEPSVSPSTKSSDDRRPGLIKSKQKKKVHRMEHQVVLEAETCVMKQPNDISDCSDKRDKLQTNRFISNVPSAMHNLSLAAPTVLKSHAPVQVTQMVKKVDNLPHSKEAEGIYRNRLNFRGVQSPISIIRHYILEKQPVMVIMRGLPGSGKSHLARLLIDEGAKMGVLGVTLSTDDYFMQQGVYAYSKNDIGIAHDWNKKRALTYVMESKSPIIIDNTNTSLWEFLPYAEMAWRYKYDVQIFEPDTAWKFKVMELSRKNSHGVSKEHIKRMKDRYEHVNIETLLKAASASKKNKEASAEANPGANASHSVQEHQKMTQQGLPAKPQLKNNQDTVPTSLQQNNSPKTKSQTPWYQPQNSQPSLVKPLSMTKPNAHPEPHKRLDRPRDLGRDEWNQAKNSLHSTFSDWFNAKDQRIPKPKKKRVEVSQDDSGRGQVTKEFLYQSLKTAFVNILKDKLNDTPNSKCTVSANDSSDLINIECDFLESRSNTADKERVDENTKVALNAEEVIKQEESTSHNSRTTDINIAAVEADVADESINSIDDFCLIDDSAEKCSHFDSSFSTTGSYRTCCSQVETMAAEYGIEGVALETSGVVSGSRDKTSPLLRVNDNPKSLSDHHLDTPATVIESPDFNRSQHIAAAEGASVTMTVFCNSLDSDNTQESSSKDIHSPLASPSSSSSSLSYSTPKDALKTQVKRDTTNTDVQCMFQKLYLSSPLVSYTDSEDEDSDTKTKCDVFLIKKSEREISQKDTNEITGKSPLMSGVSSQSESSREESPQLENQSDSSSLQTKQSKKKRQRKGKNDRETFIADSLKAKSKMENWSTFYKQHTSCLVSSEDTPSSEVINRSQGSVLKLSETRSFSSQCDPYIFSLLYKLNSSAFNKLQPLDLSLSDVTVITTSQSSMWGQRNLKSDADISRKSGTTDRSTNTDETLEREELDLETLQNCFPEYSKQHLEEVMSIYHNDIEWVSSCLLDAPAYSDLVVEDGSEEEHKQKEPEFNQLKSLADLCSSIARNNNQMDQDDIEIKVIEAGEDRLQKIENFRRSRLLSSERGQYYDSWEDRFVLEDFTGTSSDRDSWDASSLRQYKAEPPNYNNFSYKGKQPSCDIDMLSSSSGESLTSQKEDQALPVIPVSLISSLEHLYGSLDLPLGADGFMLDDHTARKIYSCLKLCSVKKFPSDKTERQLKDDEALARALQEKENALSAAKSSIKASAKDKPSVPGWTSENPSWMFQAENSSRDNVGYKNSSVSNKTTHLNRPGSVSDTLNFLRGTPGRKGKPFKFQKKMPKMAVKSVWSGPKRRIQADSLLSIMEEEKAREELQKEQMKLIELTGDTQALATRIKRTDLAQLYPSLGPDFLEEIFMNTGYSMEDTVKVLETTYGISPAPMSKERQDEILEQMKERSKEENYHQVKPVVYTSASNKSAKPSDGGRWFKFLVDPGALPTQQAKTAFNRLSRIKQLYYGADDWFDYLDDVPWSYDDLRHEAEVYHNLAKECKDQANRYLGDGMPSAALFYRQKGKDYKEREYATNHKAAEILFEKGRERLAKENTLDLHFYHLDEAVMAVNRAISLKEEEYRQRPDKKNTYLNIVTGRGRNSKDGVPILKPAVTNHLRDRCFRFEEKSPGMLRVYIGQRI
ncbi:hypothetical protein Btru_016136 [Bulinus truncatus]|nr:hypothetical protein Btru_016136 [Bulinus truncatus]